MSAQPLATDFLTKNVRRLREALDHHNATCEGRAAAFVLHPYDRGVLPFDELWGLPLVEDPGRTVKGFLVACPLQHTAGDHPGPSESE